MKKSRFFIIFTLAEILLIFSFFVISYIVPYHEKDLNLEARKELVHRLHLTDFSIWTEARYTRHPSQADFFSPFQDFPSAIEHFPAGSIISPVYAGGASGHD